MSPLFLPWAPTKVIRTWNVAAAHRALIRAAASGSSPSAFDVLWFFSPPLAGLEGRVPRRLVVYHAVDDYSANPGVKPELIESLEAELVANADLVFAASKPLTERLSSLHPKVTTWSNVSDTVTLINSSNEIVRKPAGEAPLAVYVGNLSAHKVDFELLLHVVRRQAHWRFLLAGPIGGLSSTRTAVIDEPNVRYIGPVDHDDLASAFERADVGLLPLPDTPLHSASFPIKVFDYLALGLPIVGRRSDPLSDLAEFILHATTVDEYASAMDRALILRRGDAFRRDARAIALVNSWDTRIEEFAATIRNALALIAMKANETGRR